MKLGPGARSLLGALDGRVGSVGDGMLRKPQLSQRLGQHDGRTDERAADDRRPACDEDRTWPAYSGCKDHGECRGKDQR
jgi:hypothetical protein